MSEVFYTNRYIFMWNTILLVSSTLMQITKRVSKTGTVWPVPVWGLLLLCLSEPDPEVRGCYHLIDASDTQGLACVSNHRRLHISVPLRNDVPECRAPLEMALWLPKEKHPGRVKEDFWAATELIPALISSRINPKLCDRSREVHWRLKPNVTEILLRLHTAAPSFWTRARTAWEGFGPELVEFVLIPPLDAFSL